MCNRQRVGGNNGNDRAHNQNMRTCDADKTEQVKRLPEPRFLHRSTRTYAKRTGKAHVPQRVGYTKRGPAPFAVQPLLALLLPTFPSCFYFYPGFLSLRLQKWSLGVQPEFPRPLLLPSSPSSAISLHPVQVLEFRVGIHPGPMTAETDKETEKGKKARNKAVDGRK